MLALAMIAAMSAYLGVYVVVKRIVFVGVALAEVSAMGIGFAFFASGWAAGLSIDPEAWEETGPLLLSFAFTLLGVLLFGVHHSGKRVTQEGLIGVGYAIAAGLAVLLIWESAEGMDELKNLVAGDVLLVSPLQFRVLSWSFAGLALLHALFGKEFLFSSFDKETARTLNLPARVFDLLLYLSIGVAVAVSLRAGSILLVVALMILPAVTAMLVASRFGRVQLLSVAVAVTASAAGVAFSLYGELPTGPTVVAVLSALFLGALAATRFAPARRAYAGLVAALAALAVVLVGVSFSHEVFQTDLVAAYPLARRGEEDRASHDQTLEGLAAELRHTEVKRRADAARRLGGWDDPHAVDLLCEALEDADRGVQREAVLSLGRSKSPRAREALAGFLERRELDPDLELAASEALVGHGDPQALHLLIHLAERRDAPPFFRARAYRRLVDLSGQAIPQEDAHSWHDWWEDHHGRLEWDAKENRFGSRDEDD
ncbi:MAG: metal ABC transporter permease [Planctomycetes bacterium]|nr:metal ABC transporter permease [Planctomycetota bacterium]